MRKNSTLFLQIVIVTLGIGALAFLLWEPHLEGRNVNATVFQIYFNDPFLVYAYTASVFFFVALHQAFKILGCIRQNKTFSQATVKALRTIKYCAITIVAFVIGAEAYLFIARPGDDIAGGVFIGLLMIAVFGVSVSVASMFEGVVQNSVDIKSEHDLTA